MIVTVTRNFLKTVERCDISYFNCLFFSLVIINSFLLLFLFLCFFFVLFFCLLLVFNLKLYKSLVTSILLYGCEAWTLLADSEKRFRLSKLNVCGNFSASPTWSTRLTTLRGARSTSLLVRRNPFWQLSRDGNLHDSDTSHVSTASPKPSFRARWKVGDAVVSRGNAGWTHQRVNIPAHASTAHKGRLQKKAGRGSLLDRPSCSPEDPISQGTELN